MPLSAVQLERNFALLEAAAAVGERCPQSRPFGPLDAPAAGQLARAGRIRVEIFAHNWRVVTIMEGPQRGKATAPSPHPGRGKPYKVIEKDNAPPPSERQQPWSPVRKLAP